VLHLNRTAAEYAFYLVENLPVDDAGRRMSRNYHVPQADASRDYLEFSEKIQALVSSPDLDPVTFLDFERLFHFHSESVHRTGWTAPSHTGCLRKRLLDWRRSSG
jgi:hypothetical protein